MREVAVLGCFNQVDTWKLRPKFNTVAPQAGSFQLATQSSNRHSIAHRVVSCRPPCLQFRRPSTSTRTRPGPRLRPTSQRLLSWDPSCAHGHFTSSPSSHLRVLYLPSPWTLRRQGVCLPGLRLWHRDDLCPFRDPTRIATTSLESSRHFEESERHID